MSIKAEAKKRANDFREALANLLEEHDANLNLDLVESGVDFSFDINGNLNYSDSYENKLVDFQSGEVCADDIRRSIEK